ncbi:MAG: hypothetical protein FWC68_01575 [Oscillospiraceae bacterium]|nr:hypothetical protein [Oscillospiraceae bacterium]
MKQDNTERFHHMVEYARAVLERKLDMAIVTGDIEEVIFLEDHSSELIDHIETSLSAIVYNSTDDRKMYLDFTATGDEKLFRYVNHAVGEDIKADNERLSGALRGSFTR